MKLSFCISTPDVKFKSLYREELEKAFTKLTELGYHGAELNLPDPRRVDVDSISRTLNSLGLEISAIDTGLIFLEDGLSFSDPDYEKRVAAVSRVKEYVDIASELGALVVIGLVRGKVQKGTDLTTALDWTRECFEECARTAKRENVTLTLEPLNRYETEIINTAGKALELISEINLENIALTLDTFHMNIEERSIPESINRASDYLAHVHIADSNRRAPGMGHIDFPKIIEGLSKMGYENFLSAEIEMTPTSEEALRKTIKYLGNLLKNSKGKTT